MGEVMVRMFLFYFVGHKLFLESSSRVFIYAGSKGAQ
jgi:hypothetical protein